MRAYGLMLGLAFGLALVTSFLASAAFADAAATPAPPTQVAKLAAEPPKPTAAAPPKADAAAAKPAGKQLAQLTYPVPTTSSAAALLQAADDYAFYADHDHVRQYLQQVVSAYPGTKEAGRALALLVDDAAATGDQDRAEALAAQLSAYSDPEVQAFAALIRTANSAERAKQYAVEAQALAAYADQYRGTASGGWAALRLGDVYRFMVEDYAQAISYYQGVMRDYPSGPVYEEALVSLAETYNWSENGRNAEATATYEQALDMVTTPGLQVRALIGLSDMLTLTGAQCVSIQLLSQVIDAYPSHPSTALAYTLRSVAYERQGDWDLAVADMRAFMEHPCNGQGKLARAHFLFAKDAFRKGDLAGAEAEYHALAQVADTTWHTQEYKGEAQAGLAYCAKERGDLRGAMQLFLTAADVESRPRQQALYLYQAADLAQQLQDSVSRAQIIARMAAQLPGSDLTTKLVGHEILPAPDI